MVQTNQKTVRRLRKEIRRIKSLWCHLCQLSIYPLLSYINTLICVTLNRYKCCRQNHSTSYRRIKLTTVTWNRSAFRSEYRVSDTTSFNFRTPDIYLTALSKCVTFSHSVLSTISFSQARIVISEFRTSYMYRVLLSLCKHTWFNA